jgi:hypothetical protein
MVETGRNEKAQNAKFVLHLFFPSKVIEQGTL